MLCLRFLLASSLLALAVVADAQNPPTAKDPHGDLLPSGAVARLGTVRFRHQGTIVFAAFLPGGKSVVSVGADGTICVWDFPSRARKFTASRRIPRRSGLPVRWSGSRALHCRRTVSA